MDSQVFLEEHVRAELQQVRVTFVKVETVRPRMLFLVAAAKYLCIEHPKSQKVRC